MAIMNSIPQADVPGLGVESGSGWARLVAGLRALVPGQVTAPAVPVDALDEATAAALFARAIHEDSILELDWLWLAAQVTRNVERRYCLQRALYINPHSEIARRQLLTLRVAMAAKATRSVTMR